MKKSSNVFIGLLLIAFHSFGQNEQSNIVYIIDSIPVINDPEVGNEITESDISDLRVIKNKDSLKLLGYGQLDGAIYIFSKEYRNRPESIKQIPSSQQLEIKNDVCYFRGNAYSGQFIDYYYSGRKREEGTYTDGKIDGLHKIYYQNGNMSVERYYSLGIENGLEKEFYENGSLKQKGEFVKGKEEGVWEMYFPNGQVKQRSTFKSGNMDGETTVYYSTGKILAIEMSKNGKTLPDKRLEKVNLAMEKGHASNREGNSKAALKHYSKAIELDSTFAEAYFSRGTVKLNNFQFDEALIDFNKALELEPYYKMALSNRAFARIRKHQFENSRQLSNRNGVTVLASKDNPGITESELSLICSDLEQAIFLGDRKKVTLDAVSEFCGAKVK